MRFINFIFFWVALSVVISPLAQARTRSSTKLYCEVPGAISRAPSAITSANGVTVIQAEPTLEVQGLSSQGYEVIDFDEFNNPNAWEEPSPKLRDFLIHDAGLDNYLKGWDQLAKDMFFLRAQEYAISRLSAKYPRLPLASLELLLRKIAIAKQSIGGSGR
jgi:hypothetical protein